MATVTYGDFEWDEDKAASNEEKHGVTFEEAVTAFFDERQFTLTDPQDHDDRFVLVGMSRRYRLLYVVHAEVTYGHRTRIISARIASKQIAVQYALGDSL